jgi:hypothetical protein
VSLLNELTKKSERKKNTCVMVQYLCRWQQTTRLLPFAQTLLLPAPRMLLSTIHPYSKHTRGKGK